jgi:hypothetical protein
MEVVMKAGRLPLIIKINSLLVLAAFTSASAVPTMINFQGSLTGSDGLPLDGTFSFLFSIYSVATDCEPVWKEIREVFVSSGMYSIQLGSIDPFPPDLFGSDNLFLEIQVYHDGINDWETLTPRMRLTSTAFAMKAAEAERVSNGAITSVMMSPGAMTSNVLSNNAVTAAKISRGAVGSDQISDSSVAAADVAFYYAAGSTRGGATLDLDSTDCVSSFEVQAPLSLNGASATAIVKGTNTGSGFGVQGEHGNGNYGYLGGSGAGVYLTAFTGAFGRWAEKAVVPIPAAYPAVAEVKDKIYLMGGMPVYPQPGASTFEYEPLSDAWA